MDPVTLVFIVTGLALLLSEVKLPGAVAGFFGVAALLTAAVRGIGLVESIPVSLLVWGITTTALLVPLRPMVKKFVGRSEVRNDRTDVDQDRDSMGEVVDVIEDVSDEHDQGRIRFQGTTWQARSTTGSIKKGDKANLVYRDGSLWIIEPVPVDPVARELFAASGQETVEQPAEQGAVVVKR